jgi:hypothetical protein
MYVYVYLYAYLISKCLFKRMKTEKLKICISSIINQSFFHLKLHDIIQPKSVFLSTLQHHTLELTFIYSEEVPLSHL